MLNATGDVKSWWGWLTICAIMMSTEAARIAVATTEPLVTVVRCDSECNDRARHENRVWWNLWDHFWWKMCLFSFATVQRVFVDVASQKTHWCSERKKIMNLWLQTTSKSSNEGVKCRTHEIFNFLIPHFHTLLPSRCCWRFFVAISAHFTRLECNFVLIQAFSDARCTQSESSRQKTSNPVEFTPKTVF